MEKLVTLQEAMKSKKPFKNKNSDEYIVFQEAKTGSFKDLVDCSYFIIDCLGDHPYFSTSLDLYYEEILSDEWEIKE